MVKFESRPQFLVDYLPYQIVPCVVHIFSSLLYSLMLLTILFLSQFKLYLQFVVYYNYDWSFLVFFGFVWFFLLLN